MVGDALYVNYQQSPFADSWPLDQLTSDGILSLSDDMVLHPEEVSSLASFQCSKVIITINYLPLNVPICTMDWLVNDRMLKDRKLR